MNTQAPPNAMSLVARIARLPWKEWVIYIGMVIVLLYFAITLGSTFLNTTTLVNVVTQSTQIAVMAVGTVLVLSLGEIDLSIGSTVALASLVAAVTLHATQQWWVAALAGLATGAIVGAVNGAFITALKLPSFLVTLATMGLVAGLSQQITGLQSVPVTDPTFVWIFGGGTILGIPILMIWTISALLLGIHVLRQRRFGARILAVGNNASAAAVSGIRVNRIRMSVFVISGLTAALAGILYAGRLSGATYTLGTTDMMSVLAAVIVGGTAMTGGKGTMLGAIVGSLFMSTINYGLLLAGLTVAQQMIVRGIIILIAISLSPHGTSGR
ncbi:MAG: ABC transporter permease [Bifidobacterium tibiigranuli]|jgi:ribose transport system permease protein|uniref:ABC transporter permease n=1 Tax=Bifidobacterium tibiigranuli TaxID=2172043 RepID=UPI0026EF5FBB|nr:ABC transporter permease [Bifidobacterium tibiigranuli]MCI1674418.1 ABC transporter permease [Bifidobacterium tibiigranuli]MCI1713932.1 ABC transporter permease [Bifidobacterium tibiigranuli]MCI1834732.1 ABC transporter permease [Bifidobacterium tibiigranuli]